MNRRTLRGKKHTGETEKQEATQIISNLNQNKKTLNHDSSFFFFFSGSPQHPINPSATLQGEIKGSLLTCYVAKCHLTLLYNWYLLSVCFLLHRSRICDKNIRQYRTRKQKLMEERRKLCCLFLFAAGINSAALCNFVIHFAMEISESLMRVWSLWGYRGGTSSHLCLSNRDPLCVTGH